MEAGMGGVGAAIYGDDWWTTNSSYYCLWKDVCDRTTRYSYRCESRETKLLFLR